MQDVQARRTEQIELVVVGIKVENGESKEHLAVGRRFWAGHTGRTSGARLRLFSKVRFKKKLFIDF